MCLNSTDLKGDGETAFLNSLKDINGFLSIVIYQVSKTLRNGGEIYLQELLFTELRSLLFPTRTNLDTVSNSLGHWKMSCLWRTCGTWENSENFWMFAPYQIWFDQCYVKYRYMHLKFDKFKILTKWEINYNAVIQPQYIKIWNKMHAK